MRLEYMKAIILCAGKGERLGELTKDTPKPMIPIAGKPVLEYLIRLCRKHGITDIAVNTSHLPEKIKSYFKDGTSFGVHLRYSFEQELLGTAGALNNFRDFFTETFFVIYGDNVTDLDLSAMLKFHRAKHAAATLYLYNEPLVDKKTKSGVVVVDAQGKIQEIVEGPNDDDQQRLAEIPAEQKLLNAGVYILEPQVLQEVPSGFSDFARDIFPKLVKKLPFYGFQAPCYFKEIGQLPRYLQAKEDIESGRVILP